MKISSIITMVKYYSIFVFGKVVSNKNKSKLEYNADKVEVISSSVSIPALHPYMEEENLRNIPDNVSDEWGDRSFNSILESFREELRVFPECKVLHFRNVFINKSWMFTGKISYSFNWKDKLPLSIPGKIKKYNLAIMANTYYSSRYWGHWLSQEYPLQLLLRNRGPFIGYLPREKYRDEDSWRNLVDLPHIDESESFLCNHLIMCDGQNTSIACIKEHNEIRKLLYQKNNVKKNKIYIKRGNDGQRRTLQNEEDLIHQLSKEGFSCVDINSVVTGNLIYQLIGASIVIGVEGSHLRPAMYTLNNDSLMIVLQPPCRVARNITDSCLNLGIPSAMFVCEETEKNDNESFKINVECFMNFISRADSWALNAKKDIKRFAETILQS